LYSCSCPPAAVEGAEEEAQVAPGTPWYGILMIGLNLIDSIRRKI